jgi:hypothetical protein
LSGREELRVPTGRIADPFSAGGSPVHGDRPGFPFRAADDIDLSVTIQIGPDRIFHVPHVAHGDRRPGGGDRGRSRMKTEPHRSSLLPPRRDIGPAVTVGIDQTYAVRAARGGIDDVPPPRRFSGRGACQLTEQENEQPLRHGSPRCRAAARTISPRIDRWHCVSSGQ